MLIDCNKQSDNANNDSTKSVKVFVCNILHRHHPLSLKDRGYNPLHLEGTTAFRLFGNPLGAMLHKVLYDICRILSIK